MRRGEVYLHATFPRRFVVVSATPLSELGTVITAEIVQDAAPGMFAMFTVTLTEADVDAGCGAGVVLGWRVNYTRADRLGAYVGRLSNTTMEQVDVALRAAMEL